MSQENETEINEETETQLDEEAAKSQAGIIVNVLQKYENLKEADIKNASQILDFVQYLLDDDNNLTKTFNLSKEAKDKLTERIVEVFESSEIEGDLLD